MTDPFELLSALDEPRPLPADLRSRLEDALLAAQEPRPLDAELAHRLSGRMIDPTEGLLSGLDAPRPLSPALRAEVLGRLGPRHAAPRTNRPAVWIAAAAVTAAAAVAGVLVLGSGPDSSSITAARPSPAPSPTPSSAPVMGAAGAGVGTVSAGQQPSLAPATPASVTAGAAAGAPGPAMAGSAAGGAELTSVSPDAGPLHGGTPVRLHGPGLATAQRVLFGDAAGTQLRHDKDGSVQVVTPAVPSPRQVAVVVVLKDGSRVTRSGGFTYVAPPSVDSITPASGPAAGGTWVVLSGAALARTGTVSFGSARATRIEPVSDTQVRALSPAHAPGPVEVVVTTPGGSSAPVRFLYLP
jgi:hypothetical protein